MRPLLSVLTLCALFPLTACLPSSQKSNTQALTPADSLSRQIAESVPVDSLHLVWLSDAPEDAPMELPTSLVWLPDSLGGAIIVSDTRSGALHVLDPDGSYREARQVDGLTYPYMAGHRGDTLVVLNRGANRLDFVTGSTMVRSVPLPDTLIATALATDSTLWAKRTDDEGTVLVRVNEDGTAADRYALPTPYWRSIGFLRAWNGGVLSLSGYRPLVHRPTPDGVDSLALLGFDSPQLMRSNQFMLGEVKQPPLLSSSAAVLDGRLYVLNLRPDAVRIDVYAPDPDGDFRIERVLLYHDPELVSATFPVDIAVRPGPDGRLRFALVLQKPGGILKDSGGRAAMLETLPVRDTRPPSGP